MDPPSVAVVIPAYQARFTLGQALRSLNSQHYGGQVEILVVDGGSTDGTAELARELGARVVENPQRNQEAGCATGVDASESDLVLLLDADDELPHPDWLAGLVEALDLAGDVVSADPLYHTWRREDPAINRLAALIGGTDPIAIDLGWSDRWGYHHNRWTAMPVEEVDLGSALVVRIDPEHAPPMGSNGFLVRRSALIEVGYSPFWHPEVVAALARRGWRFARVKDSVIHHFAPDTRSGLRKCRRRALATVLTPRKREVRPPMNPVRLVLMALWSVTLVGPSFRALRGFLRRPDPAWALYPVLHVTWTLSYAEALVRRTVARVVGVQPRGLPGS